MQPDEEIDLREHGAGLSVTVVQQDGVWIARLRLREHTVLSCDGGDSRSCALVALYEALDVLSHAVGWAAYAGDEEKKR